MIRHIEPYRLVFKWSSWYVFGYCLNRKDYRLFKLNRLWNITLSDYKFVPQKIPAHKLQFDNYFSADTVHLKALFPVSEKYRLIEEYGIDCFQITDSGELLLEQDFASYANMREWIFSFGDQVTILEPHRLYEDRIQQAENILKNHNSQNTTAKNKT